MSDAQAPINGNPARRRAKSKVDMEIDNASSSSSSSTTMEIDKIKKKPQRLSEFYAAVKDIPTLPEPLKIALKNATENGEGAFWDGTREENKLLRKAFDVYSEGIVDDATIASYQEILSEVTKKQADREARKHKANQTPKTPAESDANPDAPKKRQRKNSKKDPTTPYKGSNDGKEAPADMLTCRLVGHNF